MKPSTLIPILTKCVSKGLPVMLKGAPGVGKTQICRQIAESLKMNFIPVIPVISDPTDAKGIPARNGDNKWEWHLVGDSRRIVEAKKPTLVLIDDLGQAPAMVQAAYMQWILLRRIGEHPIPDCVKILAATNRREDRAGVTGILEPVKSRFVTILELTPDENDWSEWAFKNKMPTKLIAFGHFRPGLLTSFKPTIDIINGPCPRTFENAGKLINAGIEDIESLSGAVGEGCAIEMIGFFKFSMQLPDLDDVIANPNSADIPSEPAALYAIVAGLVERVIPNNVGRIFKYGSRLPKDFNILLGRDCIRKNKDLQNTKAFTKWVTENKDILVA